MADDARRYLAQSAPPNAALNPQSLSALVTIGCYHFESGNHDFPNWSKAMAKEAGRQVLERHLRTIYVDMRDKAYKRAQELGRTLDPSQRAAVSASLNSFMKIAEPADELPTERSATTPLEEQLAELNTYIGLDRVKSDIAQLVNSIKVGNLRKAQGLAVPERSLHLVFYGNPGTGKTTIAHRLAKIYRLLGVVSQGQLVCTDRAGLIARYVGQTADKVKSVVESALGGVLFIDEAYSLTPADPGNDFGQEAVQQLLLMMENHRDDLIVIVAGYPNEMNRFLESNPGLNARFNKKLFFDDYTPDQLLAIFETMCEKNDYSLDSAAAGKLLRLFQFAYGTRDRTFGNARLARNYFEDITRNLDNRIVRFKSVDRPTLITITDEDVPELPRVVEPVNRARLAPDLGRLMVSKGLPGNAGLDIPGFRMELLSVIGPGHYCTTQNTTIDEQQYCATFDFGDEILEDILEFAPDAVENLVRNELGKDTESRRTIVFPEPATFGIRARLGEFQIGLNENFVPFVILGIYKS